MKITETEYNEAIAAKTNNVAPSVDKFGCTSNEVDANGFEWVWTYEGRTPQFWYGSK